MVFTHAKAVKYIEIAQQISNTKYTMKEIAEEMQKICDIIIPAHTIVDPNDPLLTVEVAEATEMPTEYGVEIPTLTKDLRFEIYEAKLLVNLTRLKALTMA